MISPEKIEEWLHEVEERPGSAALIIRYIAGRLRELTERNEELSAENIALVSEKRVEEYERRIANLEYQLELLKRQFGDSNQIGLVAEAAAASNASAIHVLIYNTLGKVLHTALKEANFESGQQAARLTAIGNMSEAPLRLLAVNEQEELLFLFDSGRTAVLPVLSIPEITPGDLDWGDAFDQEPRGLEEMTGILPVTTMTLFEYCIQNSRRGYVKKIVESAFESHIRNNYVGSGVKLPSDKSFSLTFCNKDDLFVMVSREGAVFCMEANRLPYGIEEAVRLGALDHIVAAFNAGQKPYFMCVTNTGKVLQRETSWLEPAVSFKSRGQQLLTSSRRRSGIHLVGASAVDENDWGAALQIDGSLSIYSLKELFSLGSISIEAEESDLVSFVTFRLPGNNRI